MEADELLIASMQALEARQSEVEAKFEKLIEDLATQYSADAIADRVDLHIVERRRSKVAKLLKDSGLKVVVDTEPKVE